MRIPENPGWVAVTVLSSCAAILYMAYTGGGEQKDDVTLVVVKRTA